MIAFVILPLLALGYYLLYINGFIMFQNKRALVFMVTNHGKTFSFSECSGYLKKYFKIRNSGTYSFSLNNYVSKGEIRIKVCDYNKNILLELNNACLNKNIYINNTDRYQIIYEFLEASGSFSLTTKKES